jgi:hypothetical protein
MVRVAPNILPGQPVAMNRLPSDQTTSDAVEIVFNLPALRSLDVRSRADKLTSSRPLSARHRRTLFDAH